MARIIRLSERIETKTLKEELVELSGLFKIVADDVKNLLTVSEELTKTIQKENITHSETMKAVETTNESLNKLSKSEQDLAKAQKSAADALDKQRQTAMKQLAKLEEEERKFNDIQKRGVKTQEEAAFVNKKLVEQRKKLDTTTKDGQKQIKNINTQIDNNNKLIKNNSSLLEKQKINIGNYASAWQGLPGPLGRVASGVGGVANAFKKLLLNPIILLITAVVVAVHSLVKAFKSTDEGATFFAAQMEKVKATTSVLKQRLVDFNVVFWKFLKSDKTDLKTWNELIKETGDAFKGTSEAIDKANKAANDYTYSMDALVDAEISYISQAEIVKNTIAKLEFGAQDRTRSTAERRKMLSDAIAIGEQEVIKQKEFADRRFDIEVTNTAARFNVEKDLLIAFIAADDEAGNEMLKNNARLNDARNKFGEDRQKELEELYIKSIAADTKFFDENKRNLSKMSAFDEEAKRESAEAQKKALEDKMIAIENATNEEINLSKQAFLNKEITEHEFALKMIQLQISNTEEILNISQLSVDQRLEMETQLLDDKIALMNLEKKFEEDAAKRKLESEKKAAEDIAEIEKAKEETQKAMEEQKVKNAEEALEKRKELEEELQNVAEMGFQTWSSYLDMQQNNLEVAYDYELQMAGDNEQAREAIDQRYDEERRKLMRKQAIAAKVEGIFTAAINTAQAVTAALKVAPPLGIALAIIVGILGAAQIGFIASKEIPSFAKGVKKFKGGLANVGEEGSEAMISETGVVGFTPSHKTTMYVPRGTSIIPHEQTKEFFMNGGSSVEKWDEFIELQKENNSAIRNMTIHNTTVTERGFEYETQKGSNQIKWINKYMHR